MEANLPATFGGFAALALLLGLKHGFDADHLATIDGLTRINSRSRKRFARYCGAFFSIGHGLVVIGVALAVGTFASRWRVPDWLEITGITISVLFLAGLGLVNLLAVLSAPAHEVVRPVGLRGRLLGGLARAGSPGLVMLVGALFALSFDTVSQAAFFALAATRFGGVGHALALALLFMLGMLITDGVNGLWISRLIARSDEIARIASRVMSLAVASVSLLIAAFTAAKLLLPRLDAWSDGRELVFGSAVVLLLFAAFLGGRALAKRPLPSDC